MVIWRPSTIDSATVVPSFAMRRIAARSKHKLRLFSMRCCLEISGVHHCDIGFLRCQGVAKCLAGWEICNDISQAGGSTDLQGLKNLAAGKVNC
jgi:hypothetical protein